MFPPLGAQVPASKILRISSLGTGSRFSRRIDRVERMISNRSLVFGVASGIAFLGHVLFEAVIGRVIEWRCDSDSGSSKGPSRSTQRVGSRPKTRANTGH